MSNWLCNVLLSFEKNILYSPTTSKIKGNYTFLIMNILIHLSKQNNIKTIKTQGAPTFNASFHIWVRIL